MGNLARYEIVREVGHGGTAVVYLARQKDLGRLVALKELSAVTASDPSAARRFVRESRLAGSLNHPNIVTVHDFFEDDATPFIAMEYLERGSLRPVVSRLSFAQAAGVLEGLLAGLAHAEQAGIVHRDLKPENLLITASGAIKIADFGIAKAISTVEPETQLTAKGTTIGTPTYMAPEQATAGDVGPWTDLYAVGVIAFELFAGRPPFDVSGPPVSILLQHVNTPPLELASVDPAADPRLSDWIGALLRKDPQQRPPSATAAWLALEEIVLDRLGPRWRREAAVPAVATTPTTLDQAVIPTAMPHGPTPRMPTRRPAGAVVAADGVRARRFARSLLLVLSLIGAVMAAIAVGSGHDPAPAARGVRSTATASPAPGTSSPPAAAPTATAPSPDSGVGDSRSDDPSDDEPDGGEP